MASPAIEVTFDEALDLTKNLERDLLLGNGFSIGACDTFEYGRLLEHASLSEDVRGVFAAARTANFEAVMRILLAESRSGNGAESLQAQHKIEVLKDALIRSVHEVHPARRKAIGPTQWERCEQFLQHFIGRRRKGRIFTTNYDLLLCWAVAPDRDRRKPEKLFTAYEGFRGGDYDGCGSATIIYLHGALHLFGRGARVEQLRYKDTGIALHDQIAERLARNEFPVFVSEGASSLKEPNAPGFLRDALAAFKGTCRTPAKKVLFTLGHSLGPEDHHILKWIPNGSIPTIFLGAFGRNEMDAFQPIAASWIEARAQAGKPPLNVYVFNSADLVWGPRTSAVS